MYNWQLPDWPHFQYDVSSIEDELLIYSERVGKISGMLHGISTENHTDIIISGMVAEAMKSSEIEGEYLSRADVMSSIRNQFGLSEQPEMVNDVRAQGIAEMMMAVRETFAQDLTEQMLFLWQAMLMKGDRKVNSGQWRSHSEPMQVVSGTIGKEIVHFEAPPSLRIPSEMNAFIRWFNATAPSGPDPIRHAPIRSAIAHLYFESIHPFEDGNGRIGRAISEKVLCQHAKAWLPISISQSINPDKDRYYKMLKATQRSLKVTDWLAYFTSVLLDALHRSEEQIGLVIKKTQFFDRHGNDLSERQLKVIRRMLDGGPTGFEGGMNARKYISLTGVSKATATRDLQDLLDKGVLGVFGGGRSTGYQVNI